MKERTLSVFGLGKLGATMVGCFAASGFKVVGCDVDRRSVDLVSKGRSPVPEPGLDNLFRAFSKRIASTMDQREAVLRSEVSFIIVPTPSKRTGEFFTNIAQAVAREIGGALKEKNRYHIVVLTSTVLPTATEQDIQETLERFSGKRCGRDFGLCYSPEFIAIGEVVKGLVSPDYFLIGEHDKKSGDTLEAIYRQVHGSRKRVFDCAFGKGRIECAKAEPRMARMSIVNAELTKIAVNSYVTMKISFANTLARICSGLVGADSRIVAEAIGMDRRIGTAYIRPGGAFGGPCFPRDNRAFAWVAARAGSGAPLAETTDLINGAHMQFMVRLIRRFVPGAKKVGILGLSYKPRTNLMVESQSVVLANKFRSAGMSVCSFDPWVARHGVTEKVRGLKLVGSVGQCVARSDVVVLATPHEEFLKLKPADFKKGGRPVPLVDIWGILEKNGKWGRTAYAVPGRNLGVARR